MPEGAFSKSGIPYKGFCAPAQVVMLRKHCAQPCVFEV